VRLHPFRRFFRPPETSVVLMDLGLAAFFPGFQDRVDNSPGRFNLISASEQARVTLHCIEQQALVGLGHHALKFSLEAKIQVSEAQLHSGIWNFGLQMKLNSFGRLHLDHESIATLNTAWATREQQ